MQAKNIIIAILALVLIGAVSYLFVKSSNDTIVVVENTPTDTGSYEDVLPVEPDGGIGDGAEPLPDTTTEERGNETTLGYSVEGEPITAYHFGNGQNEILLVGGVHGGYSPNTAALAEEFISYLTNDDSVIPENVSVTIIPDLNPDGRNKSGTEGRFNANEVDLNRNFDCDWSADAVWQSRAVSGGSTPFSEPEAQAIKNYVERYEPAAAIVWFSAEGKVYPSACETTPSRASVELAATFATAAGYPAAAEFDAYAITGDMVNWMAKQGIPAISILLTDHQQTEWSKNVSGLEAILNTYR